MKLPFGQKQPIPKHIYDQAQAAKLGKKPDFYGGPVVTTKPKASDGPSEPDGDSLERLMTETREKGRQAAEEKRGPQVTMMQRISRLARLLPWPLSRRPRPVR